MVFIKSDWINHPMLYLCLGVKKEKKKMEKAGCRFTREWKMK